MAEAINHMVKAKNTSHICEKFAEQFFVLLKIIYCSLVLPVDLRVIITIFHNINLEIPLLSGIKWDDAEV